MTDSLTSRIDALRQHHNAVILVHNYQRPEVQDIADFVGDSLGLSRKAAATDADVIVFCGVYFMAETAKILSPDKTVLIPDPEAGCPMVHMAPLQGVLKLKKEHPSALVVTYVNSSAEVKAQSDYCCTSANAVEVVQSIPEDQQIIFVPDQHLGTFVKQQTGRDLILYPGYCPTHARITAADVQKAKREHPEADVIVHPECRQDVIQLADAALSTSGMLRYAAESDSREFLVGTETDMLYRLRKENPDKEFFPVTDVAVCPNMKKITLEKVLWSLQDMKHKVEIETETARKASNAVQRMVEITGS
jgi:quinolinate synthase